MKILVEPLLKHNLHFFPHIFLGMELVRPYTVVPPSLFEDHKDDYIGKSLHLMVKIYKDGALTGSTFASLKKGNITAHLT